MALLPKKGERSSQQREYSYDDGHGVSVNLLWMDDLVEGSAQRHGNAYRPVDKTANEGVGFSTIFD